MPLAIDPSSAPQANLRMERSRRQALWRAYWKHPSDEARNRRLLGLGELARQVCQRAWARLGLLVECLQQDLFQLRGQLGPDGRGGSFSFMMPRRRATSW